MSRVYCYKISDKSTHESLHAAKVAQVKVCLGESLKACAEANQDAGLKSAFTFPREALEALAERLVDDHCDVLAEWLNVTERKTKGKKSATTPRVPRKARTATVAPTDAAKDNTKPLI